MRGPKHLPDVRFVLRIVDEGANLQINAVFDAQARSGLHGLFHHAQHGPRLVPKPGQQRFAFIVKLGQGRRT